MQEFMLYIRNEKDAKNSLTEVSHLAFVKKCETYIEGLKSNNLLIAAQPLLRQGKVIKFTAGEWMEKDIANSSLIKVGYYHIRAENLDQAVTIARANPEFDYVPSASIEIRPIKMKEDATGFVYPNQQKSM
jgi:hypothetical protein